MTKPTKEQTLNEPAGPRIDGWFAEFVMGWKDFESINKWQRPPDKDGYFKYTKKSDFKPSTNISHAMMGVEKYKHLGIELVWCEDIKNWSVWFGGRNVLDYIYANTLELAITRALIL